MSCIVSNEDAETLVPLLPLVQVYISDYLGSTHFIGATLERAGIVPDPSMAQIRQAITEYAVLPLGSQRVHEKLVPHIKALLLYGHHNTGKKLLAHAIANSTGTHVRVHVVHHTACYRAPVLSCSLTSSTGMCPSTCSAQWFLVCTRCRYRCKVCHSTRKPMHAGSNFFNLTPRNTDGKFPKKAVAMMLHIVFKVARTMAPSVIFIDEVEKVFLSDKKKLKEFASVEPYNRIKKDLVKVHLLVLTSMPCTFSLPPIAQSAIHPMHRVQEMKQLKPGDRVLVVGSSSEPYLCSKKDEAALVAFFQKHIHMPLPDYASRQIIWPGLLRKHGVPDLYDFDWPTLAQISENYSSGQLDLVVASLLSEQRLQRLKLGHVSNALQMQEFVNWLALLKPISHDVDKQIRTFADKTPARAALAAPIEPKKPSSGKGKKEK
jgi:SpoVK/Ycf46/Vps4 family AAA+-type ATPase